MLRMFGRPGVAPRNLGKNGLACGAVRQTGVSSPSTGNNFFFTQQRSAWWQVVGGDIYAGSTGGGTVIRSLIPGSVLAGLPRPTKSPRVLGAARGNTEDTEGYGVGARHRLARFWRAAFL